MKERTITIIKAEDGEYYWKPLKATAKDAQVPAWLFFGYVDLRSKLRDVREEIESYFAQKKIDKPLYIPKNHECLHDNLD